MAGPRSRQFHPSNPGTIVLALLSLLALLASFIPSAQASLPPANDNPTSRLISAADPEGKTILHGYDAAGNRTSLRDPDGNVTTYAYDALNRLVSVGTAGGFTNYVYDRDSRLVSAAHPNGASAAYAYDAAHRITGIANRKGGSSVSTYAYAYDANGNRTRQEETNGGALEATTYLYDAADRLIAVAYSDKTVSYTHDGAGNRTSEKAEAGGVVTADRTYSYSSGDHLLQVTDNLDASKSALYAYDANGSRIGKTIGGTTTELSYDARNRLSRVTRGGSLLASFAYDAEGRRREKTGQTGRLKYVYDGDSVLLETDELGSTVARYAHGPGRLHSIEHIGEGRLYYHQDALGSTVNLTTSAGTIQATYRLDAWGSVRGQLGGSYNARLFTGKERDEETGLLYFGARHYDPEVGRFLTEDPYPGDPFTPPSLHRYLYAFGNPLRYIDPYGYYSWEAFGEDVVSFFSGVGAGVYGLGYEAVAAPFDFGQVLYYTAKGAVTGEFEDVSWKSGIGKAAESGMGTGEILLEAGKGIILTPVRLGEALGRGDAEKAGEESVNLALLLAGGRGGFKALARGSGEGEAAVSTLRQAVREAPKIAVEGGEGPVLAAAEGGMGASALRTRVMNAVEESRAAGTDPVPQSLGAAARGTPGSAVELEAPSRGVPPGTSTRVQTTVGNLRRAELRDAHHIIQDAAVRDLSGYSTELAPGVQLPGPSSRAGTPHYAATRVQAQAGGGTYAAEQQIAYKALRRAGFSREEALAEIKRADEYFRSIGVTPETPTRIPGNR